MPTVAAADPEHAWFPVARDLPSRSSTATAANRMVATPYTKLMTAIMDVDMAAALLLATEARADAPRASPDRPAGVPAGHRGRRGAAGHGLPPRPVALAGAGRGGACRARPAGADDVAHLDLYSCFARRSASPGTPWGSPTTGP